MGQYERNEAQKGADHYLQANSQQKQQQDLGQDVPQRAMSRHRCSFGALKASLAIINGAKAALEPQVAIPKDSYDEKKDLRDEGGDEHQIARAIRQAW